MRHNVKKINAQWETPNTFSRETFESLAFALILYVQDKAQVRGVIAFRIAHK